MIGWLEAAWWSWRAAGVAKADVVLHGFEARVPTPPAIPAAARRGVFVGLRLRRSTCLVRSLVIQTWDAAHGLDRALIIGVTRPAEEFAAHAWLEGDGACPEGSFVELSRRPPR